jgi:hypothetical protein
MTNVQAAEGGIPPSILIFSPCHFLCMILVLEMKINARTDDLRKSNGKFEHVNEKRKCIGIVPETEVFVLYDLQAIRIFIHADEEFLLKNQAFTNIVQFHELKRLVNSYQTISKLI